MCRVTGFRWVWVIGRSVEKAVCLRQAFILPQDTPRTANFRDYVKTVDATELEAGLDFFSELPDPQEALLEAAGAYWLE